MKFINQYKQNNNIIIINIILLMIFKQVKISSIRVGYIILSTLPWLILGPLFTYYVAVHIQGYKPYPHVSISTSAYAYPQNIVFRLLMLICAAPLQISYLIIFRYVNSIAKKINHPKKLLNLLDYISTANIFFYMIIIATTDSDGLDRNLWQYKLHVFSALHFFITTCIFTLTVTIFMTKIRNKVPNVISYWSLKIKQIIVIYVGFLWIYALTMVGWRLIVNQWLFSTDYYGTIVEWNHTLLMNLWIITFAYDLKDVEITLLKNQLILPETMVQIQNDIL